MRVLVTGAGGYFGRQIVPALVADPRVREVVATDRTEPSYDLPRVRCLAHDLLVDEPAVAIAGIDTVVHLAFMVERRPGADPAALNDVALRRFLAAAAAGVDRLIFASSVMAYGLPERLDRRLREEDPPAAGRGFYYAEQKLAAEAYLRGLTPTARAAIVCARPVAVGGPTIAASRAALYRAPLIVIPRVSHPLRLQMLHEADLGPAFATLLDAPAGVYNLAPDDEITLPEVAALLGRRTLRLPLGLMEGVTQLAWRLGASHLGGDWVRSLETPTHVADNAKLRALGWAPRYTSREAILAMANQSGSPL